MIGDVDIGGVYVDALLIWAGVAFLVCSLLRRLIEPLGFYRLVWHRALFDLAVFTIVLSLLAVRHG